MAAQITHTVLARKFYDQFLLVEDEQKYFVGSVFPDIRYLKVIRRNQTHWQSFNLKKAKEKGPFYLGIMVHSLTDIVRSEFVFTNPEVKKELSKQKDQRLFSVALKLLEDEIIYPKISDWGKYVNFLTKPLDEELLFGIDKDKINLWHKLLQENFSYLPNNQTRSDFLSKLGVDKDYISQTNNLIRKIKRTGVFIKMIEELYDKFESLAGNYL